MVLYELPPVVSFKEAGPDVQLHLKDHLYAAIDCLRAVVLDPLQQDTTRNELALLKKTISYFLASNAYRNPAFEGTDLSPSGASRPRRCSISLVPGELRRAPECHLGLTPISMPRLAQVLDGSKRAVLVQIKQGLLHF